MINVSVLLYKYVLKPKDYICFSIIYTSMFYRQKMTNVSVFLYKYLYLKAKDDKCFSIVIQVYSKAKR